MNCEQAQNELLSAESLTMLGPELSTHIAECPQCQALLAKLRKLEAATRSLPVPAGHEQPSPEFMQRLREAASRKGPVVRHLVRRVIAAAVVLAFALAAISLIFFNGSTVQADVLIGQLVDWNLAIAHTHDAANRSKVYQQQAAQLQKQVNDAHLSSADQALAVALLNNAQWMTTEENASDESQHFRTLANQLHDRQQAATDGAATHLQQIYQQLMTQGVNGGSGSSSSPTDTQHNSQSLNRSNSSFELAEFRYAEAPWGTAAVGSAGSIEGEAAMVVAPHVEYTASAAPTGDSGAENLPRSTSAAENAPSRSISQHPHHVFSHSTGVDTGATTDATHSSSPINSTSTNVAVATSSTSSLTPAHTTANTSNADPSNQSHSNVPPPPPASGHGLTATNWSNQGSGSTSPPTHAGLLASLRSLGDFSLTSEADTDGLPMTLGMRSGKRSDPWSEASEIGMTADGTSRSAIDARLAEQIDARTYSDTDLSLPHPPPMSTETCDFFDSGDFGRSPIVVTPEPGMTLVVLAAPLLWRRRRRPDAA